MKFARDKPSKRVYTADREARTSRGTYRIDCGRFGASLLFFDFGQQKKGMDTMEKEREAVTELFGSKVFDERIMKARLSAQTYRSLKKTIDEGATLDLSVANAVAEAMKDWAVEQGGQGISPRLR